MYQYRIFRQTWRGLKWLLAIPVIPVIFLVTVEYFYLFLAIHRKSSIAGYLFIGLPTLFIATALLNYLGHRRRHRILYAQGFELKAGARHHEIKKYLAYLVHYGKRLSYHPLLTEDQAAGLLQKIEEIQNIVHHHPLNDDLIRAIGQLREDVIFPTFRHLDTIKTKLVQAKAHALVQDLYQPPFPIIAPWVVGYHQLTLISEITNLYMARPSLGESFRVIRDVWDIMSRGDFLRYGQELFSGIDNNSAHLGPAREYLGEAVSILWLTHAIGEAATLRCCTLHDWKLPKAIEALRAQKTTILEAVRRSMLSSAASILKVRIRHLSPADGRDATLFAEETMAAFIKSFEAVMRAMGSSTPPVPEAKDSPLASAFLTDKAILTSSAIVDTHTPQDAGIRRHRRRRRHTKPSFGQFIRTFFFR